MGAGWAGETEEAGRAPGYTAIGMPGWKKGPQGQHGQQARSDTAGAHQQGGPASSQVRVPAPVAQVGIATTAGNPGTSHAHGRAGLCGQGSGIQQEKND